MDVIPPRHSRRDDATDEPRRTPPKCCPFCLAEALVTSWDSVARCTRYECCGCFEVFGRLTSDRETARSTSGRVVDFQRYRETRSSAEGG